jgi:hypothetical protein
MAVHQGKNIKRFREWFGWKQEVLADKLGDDWTQSKVSLLENKEVIEPKILDEVAKAMGIQAEALKALDADQQPVSIVANHFAAINDNASGINYNHNCSLNFNPVDKIVELYERIVDAKNEMINKLMEGRLLESGQK